MLSSGGNPCSPSKHFLKLFFIDSVAVKSLQQEPIYYADQGLLIQGWTQ